MEIAKIILYSYLIFSYVCTFCLIILLLMDGERKRPVRYYLALTLLFLLSPIFCIYLLITMKE